MIQNGKPVGAVTTEMVHSKSVEFMQKRAIKQGQRMDSGMPKKIFGSESEFP